MTDDFFSYLCELINQINGRIALIGDLNIAANRPFRWGETEDKFFEMINEAGLYTRFQQPTRKNVQLDYVFSNFPGVKCKSATDASISVLSTNDHDAICIQFEFFLDVIDVPEKLVSINKLDACAKEAIMNFGTHQLLENPNLPLGRLTLENDILMFQTQLATQRIRTIKAHKRVRGASRQMSATIFNKDLEPIVKQDKLAEQRLVETARRVRKNINSPKLAHSLYAIYSMTAKSNQLLECKIDPERFAEKILKDEKRNNHSLHPPRQQMIEIMLPKEQVVTKDLLTQLKSKWIDKDMFCGPFWRYIASGTFTKQDKGVYTYNSVETVIKDKTCSSELKGWRSVWKTPSISEKTLDLIRASHVNSNILHNDAYCPNRSTQRTLAQIFSWYIGTDQGLFGIDFVNAFAEVCRSCANTLFGNNLVSKNIEFSCATKTGRSKDYISINGSGAGRATGGPAFNLCFQQIVIQLTKEGINLSDICPYADDSQIRTKLTAEKMNRIVKCFKAAHEIGLQVHASGKKGPTLLVSNRSNVPEELLNEVTGVDIAIKEEITFLGIELSIDRKTNYLKSALTKKTKQLLGFYVNEMSRTIWTYNNKNPIVNNNTDIFDKISQAVASFLESRMQYSIAYADAKTIVYFFNIHRKAICSLLGFTTTSFGFKWGTTNGNFVEDLFSFLDDLCSSSYRKLCMLAGKPSLMAMAYRAVTVIQDQLLRHSRAKYNKFSMKMRSFLDRYGGNSIMDSYHIDYHMEPKKNEFFKIREHFTTLKERRIFVRAAVDCLLLPHLYARGYDTPKLCRVCNNADETFAHVLSEHITVPVGPGLKRTIGKYSKREKRLLNYDLKGNQSRVVLFPDAECCYALTLALKGVEIQHKLPYRPPKNPKPLKRAASTTLERPRCKKRYPP